MSSDPFGLSTENLKELIETIQNHLKGDQHPTLWIFGSRARGTHRKHSDVDLLLTHENTLTDNQLSNIKSDLEESHLPFKFDLIRESEVYPAYRETIEKEKIKLHQF